MLKDLVNQNSISIEYKNLVSQINALEIHETYDYELRAKTFELKKISKRTGFNINYF